MLTSAMDVLTYSCGTSFTKLNDDNDSRDSDSIYPVVHHVHLNCIFMNINYVHARYFVNIASVLSPAIAR